jgi:uncharacterized membrane protein YvlD (DUF360 family)
MMVDGIQSSIAFPVQILTLICFQLINSVALMLTYNLIPTSIINRLELPL